MDYLHFDKAHASAKTAKRICREYLGAHDGYVFTGTNNTLISPCVLLLEQWVMSVILLERHERKLRNHKNPVQVVGQHRSIRSRIVPSDNGIQNSPASTAVELRIAALGCQLGFARLRRLLTLTCQILRSISYDPGPSPSSAASPPTTLFHCCCSKSQIAREKRPAATR